MRFYWGAVPEDFDPDAEWRPIREPGPALMQVIALPIGLLCMAAAAAGWIALGESLSLQPRPGEAWVWGAFLVLSFPAIIVVHELLHALVHPGFGLSRATVLGVWPSRLLFYAHYAGPLTRNRFLAVFVMPLLGITVLPMPLAALGILPPPLQFAAAWCSIWNALFACGDLVGLALIFFQVPRRAAVRNRGWRTYWRPAVDPA